MEDLKTRWNRFANNRAGRDDYFTLTSAHHSLTRALLPLVEQHAAGRILDLGAGCGAYRAVLARRGTVVAVDIQPCSPALDLLADGRSLPFASGAFDTVFCSQVLEHTPQPQHLLVEAHRVLRAGGTLILSAPHISYLHAAPHDYYRYTGYGLESMLQQAGFAPLLIRPAGGLLALLGSLPPTVLLALLPHRPAALVGTVLWINRLHSRFVVAVDGLFDRGGLFALNFVAVARKAADSPRADFEL